jgi:hypothetical protein
MVALVREHDDADARRDEVDRHRLAAEEALHQLDWCVNYLHHMRKHRIARVIAANRSSIRRQMNQTGA